jgi:hypothetical protein
MAGPILIIILLLHIILTHAMNDRHYKIQKNTNVGSNIAQLIKSFKIKNKLKCVIQCNINDQCLSLEFSEYSDINDNCFIYKQYFDSTEISQSNVSDLLQCECKNFKNFFKNSISKVSILKGCPMTTINETACVPKGRINLAFILKTMIFVLKLRSKPFKCL